MRTIGGHAVVIGAGLGGLLAARVLSEAYERVTLVERDQLPEAVRARRGVPQGRHGHGLHPRGLQALEELFPAFAADAAAAGAVLLPTTELRGIFGGHEFRRVHLGAPCLSASRPFLEEQVRRRVRALPGVQVQEGRDVVGLVAEAGRVAGARTYARRPGSAEETVAADLVVDASGRSSCALRWLAELGHARPREDELAVGVHYATRHVRLATGALGGDKIVVVGPHPGHPYGLYVAAQEHGTHVVTAFGYTGHEPPRDDEGFAAFLAAVAPADVAPALLGAEPLGEVAGHRMPSSLRRRYELLRTFPAGLLVFGDAICSFNPIYGQGMSVAALQALALRAELARGRLDARRFFRAAAGPVGDAWGLAAGSDLALPEVPGRPSAPDRLLNAYVARVERAAAHDPASARAFLRVMGMLDRPSALLRPGLVARVVRTRPSESRMTPERPPGVGAERS